MQENLLEKKQAIIWFIFAGIFAISLLLFLISADLSITYGDGPSKADKLLSEVRLAQTSLPSQLPSKQ